MSILKKNIAANISGNIWTGLMGIVFVPLYIRFIGIEAYGLMGIFATLLGLTAVLDMGLSSTLNRELARLAVQKDSSQTMKNIVRTMEIPYWATGVIIAASIILTSPLIVNHWVHAENLTNESIRNAIILMGLCFAFQWPQALYSGGLMGLQRQVLLNGITITVSTLRGVGAVFILWLVSPTVEAFFIWQFLTSVLNIVLIAFFFCRSLPATPDKPVFSPALLKDIRRFAAGLTGTTVLATILTQLDKVILSRMLSLTDFGYYTLACAIASVLYRFINPVFSAVYPRLTNLVTLNNSEEIRKLFHKSSQLVSAFILPAALVVALFSKEILMLWTHDSETTGNTFSLVTLRTIGTALHCLCFIPHALQLAYGWVSLSFYMNLVSVILLVPLTFFLTKLYAASGAASVWVLLTVGYVFVALPLMHRRLLTREKWKWYFSDVGRPFIAAAIVTATGRIVIKPDWPTVWIIVSLIIVSLGAFCTAACNADQLDVVASGKSLVGMVWSKLFHPNQEF